MNRRGFLSSLIGGVAATAAVRTWPFRVYSFPSEIVEAKLLSVHSFEFGQGYLYGYDVAAKERPLATLESVVVEFDLNGSVKRQFCCSPFEIDAAMKAASTRMWHGRVLA